MTKTFLREQKLVAALAVFLLVFAPISFECDQYIQSSITFGVSIEYSVPNTGSSFQRCASHLEYRCSRCCSEPIALAKKAKGLDIGLSVVELIQHSQILHINRSIAALYSAKYLGSKSLYDLKTSLLIYH